MSIRLAVTAGDPRGIGPEIINKALADPRIGERSDLVVIGPERCGLKLDVSIGKWKTDGGAALAGQLSGKAIERMRGNIWVTRRDVFVDRIASAWLIRRFIDPKAQFRFVAGKTHRPARGEVRFDMYEAEYTHEGDRCTFETIVLRAGLRDRALRAVGEIVHDIDCKDGKFGREEAPGVAAMLRGLVRTYSDDATRLDRGAALYDQLYAAFE